MVYPSGKESQAVKEPQAVLGDPSEVLRNQFGLDRFLHGQHAVIERLLAGKSVAAVFPTGGGKSLCYQLPSQMLPGTTIVVSPLIALMKDQCDSLAKRGIAATRLDSTLSGQAFGEAMDGIRSGATKLLFVAPERFFNERFLASIQQLNVSLFAIDEAHCISQWGHNFRPDYLKMADLCQHLNVERVLALTATATPQVLSDIRDAFQIEPEDAIRTRFHRPNLQLRSAMVDEDGAYAALLDRLRNRPTGSTLVYVTLQSTAEEIAEKLTSDGISATAYHAGMKPEVREEIQHAFISADDSVVVATIAFGMGIDKPNIRYVYHFNPPKSLESYAQEIGRAGRDGGESICEVLLNPDDRIVLENFVYGDTPSRHSIGRFVELVAGQSDPFHLSHYQLSNESDVRVLVLRTLLTYLELDGYIQATSPRYDTYRVNPLVTSETILDHFQGDRRKFVGELLSCLTKSRKWFHLNMILAAKKLQVERPKIVRAIEYMSEKHWLEVQASDLVHGYRWIRRIDDSKTLADDLHERLIAREQAETQRIDEVFELVLAHDCQSGRLAKHFGESLEQDCGTCTHCRGDGPWTIAQPSTRSMGTSARRVIDELSAEYPDRFTTARDKARFLCGLSSPGFVRARLTRHESYGICHRIPFATVLAELES